MTDIFNVKKLEKDDIKYLKYINQFWLVDLNKYINKINKFKIKRQETNILVGKIEKDSDYLNLWNDLLIYRKFLKDIDSKFENEIKLLGKLLKYSMPLYVVMGYLNFVKILCDYFKKVETTEIPVKKKYLKEKFDDKVEYVFKNYCSLIKGIIKDDNYINMTFEKFSKANSIESYIVISKSIFLYSKLLLKSKKIQVTDVIIIKKNTFWINSFLLGLTKYKERILDSVK